MIESKLITVTDEGTEMGFLATRLQARQQLSIPGQVAAEEKALWSWGYASDYRPFYMLLSEVKGGNPVKSSINEHAWDHGGTGYQAFIKIRDNWDDLGPVDTVDVEQEREAYWEARQA